MTKLIICYFFGQIQNLLKMMFGKLQNFFWYDHSNACRKCPNVLLYNTPMWNGARQKIPFFLHFSTWNYRFFSLNLDFTWKVDCFEVYYVVLARRLTKFDGGCICNCSLWSPLPNLSIFKLHQHDVPQKITFFKKIYDCENENTVQSEKLEKIQFYCFHQCHVGVLCSKTLSLNRTP